MLDMKIFLSLTSKVNYRISSHSILRSYWDSLHISL